MVDKAGADAGAFDAVPEADVYYETDAPRQGPSDEEKAAMALESARKKVEKAKAHLADAEAHLAELEG